MNVNEGTGNVRQNFGESTQYLQNLLQSGNLFLNGLRNLIERTQNSGNFQEGMVTSVQNTENTYSKEEFLDIAYKLYKLRRKRDTIFQNSNLFGEPAWDILLDLFIAGETGKPTSVTSACIGSAVPATTALRWLKELEREGLLMRDVDKRDARRTFVRLSPKADELMRAYFRCYT